MVEFISVFCIVLGLILAWQTFRGKTTEKSDALQELRILSLEKFDLLTRTNQQIIVDLTNFGDRYHQWEEMFLQGLTLRQCVNILDEVRDKILNEASKEVLQLTHL